MPPYVAAAAASRMVALHATAHRDPAPLGIRALVAAIAPYAATSRIFVMDAAAESSAAAGESSAAAASRLIRDLMWEVAPRLPLLTAVTPVGASSTTSSIGALVPVTHLQPYAATGFVNAAAATRASGIGELGHLFVNNAARTPGHLVGAASASASRASCIGAPGHLFFSTDAVSGASRHLAAAGIGAPRHLFTTTLNTAASLRRPPLQCPSFFTRALSTNAGPGKPAARIFRQLNKREMARVRREMVGVTREVSVDSLTRARQEVGVGSLDILLRDLGYFTRGPFARFLGLFTVLTVMSEGVRECKTRFKQLSRCLKWNGVVECVPCVECVMGDNFSWIFD